MANENKTSLLDIVKILKAKKQIILQGAPGTGKTYTTAEIAVLLCDGELPKDGSRTAIMERYQKLTEEGRIGFTTFHQSMDYEQFVEGIVPVVQEGKASMTYEVRDGIFKKMAVASYKINENLASEAYKSILEKIDKIEDWGNIKPTKTSKDNINFPRQKGKAAGEDGDTTSLEMILKILRRIPDKNIFEDRFGNKVTRKNSGTSGNTTNHTKVLNQMFKLNDSYLLDNSEKGPLSKVLIIDEINRGNISKILGELITLLEVDKRQGKINEMKATLPYSREEFSVPQNLYIIGTMNTADRSVGYIDYAVRRRFAFCTIEADEEVIANYYKEKNNPSLQEKALNMFGNIKGYFTKSNTSSEVEAKDIMVGHSYFLAENEEELKFKYEYEIKPLLKEYHSDGLIKEYDEDKDYDKVIIKETNKTNDNV